MIKVVLRVLVGRKSGTACLVVCHDDKSRYHSTPLRMLPCERDVPDENDQTRMCHCMPASGAQCSSLRIIEDGCLGY